MGAVPSNSYGSPSVQSSPIQEVDNSYGAPSASAENSFSAPSSSADNSYGAPSSASAALADEYFPPSQNEPASFTYSAADDSSFSTDLSDSFGSADSFGSGLSDSYGSPSFEDPIISDNSGLDSYGGTSSYDAPAVPSLSGRRHRAKRRNFRRWAWLHQL